MNGPLACSVMSGVIASGAVMECIGSQNVARPAWPASIPLTRESEAVADPADKVGKTGAATGGPLTREAEAIADPDLANPVDEVDSIAAGCAGEAISTSTLSVESAIADGLCDSAMEADTVSDPSPSPFEALDAQEQQDKIGIAVALMAPDVRAAWNGLAYDGISWSELGRREGISDNGARKRYKPKFLDAFLAVGLDEYYSGDAVDRDRAKK